jgi:hypothetical protein
VQPSAQPKKENSQILEILAAGTPNGWKISIALEPALYPSAHQALHARAAIAPASRAEFQRP